MERLDSVVEALHLWQLDSTVPGHLNLEDISRLAEDGGLAAADKSQMEHLSRCPTCMQEWVAWRQACSHVEAAVERDQHVGGFGFLQAASSDGNKPFRLKSSCGRFSIDVLPQVDRPERAMMVFETVTPVRSDYEGQTATVRDRDHKVVLQGELHNGQFARVIDGWDQFDLRKWTVFFRE